MNAMSSLKKLLTGATTATREVTAAIDQLRAKRLVALDELDRLNALPHPRQAIIAGLDRDLDLLAEQARGAVYMPSLLRGTPGPTFRPPNPEAMIGLLVTAHRETFRAQIIQQVDAALAGQEVMAPGEREAALRKIAADLEDLEFAEEALIRTAEREGLSILRREDADADVLLLSDEEF